MFFTVLTVHQQSTGKAQFWLAANSRLYFKMCHLTKAPYFGHMMRSEQTTYELSKVNLPMKAMRYCSKEWTEYIM